MFRVKGISFFRITGLILIFLLVTLGGISVCTSNDEILHSSEVTSIKIYTPSEVMMGQSLNFFVTIKPENEIDRVSGRCVIPDPQEVFEYEGPKDGDYSYYIQDKKGIIEIEKVDIRDEKVYLVFKNIKALKNSDLTGKSYEFIIWSEYKSDGDTVEKKVTREVILNRGPPSNMSPNSILLISLPLIGLATSALLFLWLYFSGKGRF